MPRTPNAETIREAGKRKRPWHWRTSLRCKCVSQRKRKMIRGPPTSKARSAGVMRVSTRAKANIVVGLLFPPFPPLRS